MLGRNALLTITLAATLATTWTPANAFDQSIYPDWKGVWNRLDPPRWEQPNNKAPLTQEYKALYDWNTADQAAGGHGLEPSWNCLPGGMPRLMNVYEPMEIVITPATLYMLISHIHDNRRIYTDGRPWPNEIEPTFKGLSIGNWLDTDGDGRYDMLEVETRGIKGPRAYDTTGLPLHKDNRTIVKELIYLDKADRMVLWDDITTIDNALTRPWTVRKKLTRSIEPRHNWIEEVCSEHNEQVHIGKDNFFLSADGMLMPSRKDQAPPDLKYFKQTKK